MVKKRVAWGAIYPAVISIVVLLMVGVGGGIFVSRMLDVWRKANAIGLYMQKTEQLAGYEEVLKVLQAQLEQAKLQQQAANARAEKAKADGGEAVTPVDPDAGGGRAAAKK